MQHIRVLRRLGSIEADFEALVETENILETRFGEAGSTDRHDFGSGEMNVFIQTDQPSQAFAKATEILSYWPA